MFKLVVTPGGYAEGDNTLVEVHDEDGFYGHLSVNLPEQLAPDLFWLKDWSENRDMAESLIADGFIAIEPLIRPVASGFVAVKAARVLRVRDEAHGIEDGNYVSDTAAYAGMRWNEFDALSGL